MFGEPHFDLRTEGIIKDSDDRALVHFVSYWLANNARGHRKRAVGVVRQAGCSTRLSVRRLGLANREASGGLHVLNAVIPAGDKPNLRGRDSAQRKTSRWSSQIARGSGDARRLKPVRRRRRPSRTGNVMVVP